jgi:hypothetical protein
MSAMIMHLRVGYDYASARICASAVIVNLPATDENLRYCQMSTRLVVIHQFYPSDSLRCTDSLPGFWQVLTDPVGF